MGFPVATAYYKKRELCKVTSRPKGSNLFGATNKLSFCAEYRLYLKLCHSFSDFIKCKGKKLVIVIDINGECSKPCRNCQKFFTIKLPFCKMKYKEKGEFKQSNPVFIDSKYSKGFSRLKW
jgi:hypothetical protein